MVQYIPRFNASLALSFALFAAACTAKTDNNAAADSALNKDIQLANRDTAAQPALTDVPASSTAPAPTTTATTARTTTSRTANTRTTTRTPTTTTRTPTTTTTSSGNTVTRTSGGAAAGAGRVGTIPAGAELNLASGSKVCTNTNHVGDRFNASVTNAVQAPNAEVIPAGATATVEGNQL